MEAKNVVGMKGRLKIAAATPPHLTYLSYHGGPVLSNVEVTTIYWGTAWVSDPLRTQLDAFFNFVVQSSLITQLGEYGVPSIGFGRHVQSLVLATNDPPNPCDDSVIQAELDSLIAAGKVLAPNQNSVYFLFLPSGVTVTLQGQSSCKAFCGYHNLSNSGLVYAVDTYDDCAGCQFVSGDTLASSTVVASHELCESITDPHLDGWFDDSTGEEIGDICEGGNKVISSSSTQDQLTPNTYIVSGNATAMADGSISGSFSLTPSVAPPPTTGQSWTVQKEWSNALGACV